MLNDQALIDAVANQSFETAKQIVLYAIMKDNLLVWEFMETVKTYQIDDQLPLGHGEKSVMLIQCYIRLKMHEVMAIRWHMGFSEAKENWNSLGAAMEKYPLVLAIHEADLEASKILEVNE